MTIYAFAEGTRYNADPQVIGAHLDKLKDKHGGKLETASVLKDAEKTSSPLHQLFQWNDEAAAHQYRLWQARKLIGAVVVKYQDQPDDAQPIRAFVSVAPTEETRRYVSVDDALQDPAMRKEVLTHALNDLRKLEAKYKGLVELARVFSEVDQVEHDQAAA